MKYIILIIVIAALLLYFFLPAGKDKDASGEIELLLNNLIKSAEKEDIDVVMEYFSPEYSDSDERTYTVVKNIIENAFDRFDTIDGGYSGLIVSTTKSKNGETETSANLDIWIKGIRAGSNYKLIGSENNPNNVDIRFESIMFGGWKILSLEGTKY